MSELNDYQKAMRMYPNQRQIAEKAGISIAAVSAMYTGRRPPSKRLLDAIGWERVVTYRPKRNTDKEV